uniref:Heme NO-binding domain-containing protein n=1 Tax=Panagrolaimus sp. JU765 TaxID=591449 RepID=A0AC34RQD6_9BILA
MYGFVHDTIYQMISQKYGKEFWMSVLKEMKFEKGTERHLNQYYSDKDTFALVDTIAGLLEVQQSDIWEMYGAFLIQYTMDIGWNGLLQSVAPTLEGFLSNLDGIHYFIDHFVYKANLNGPGFRCETGLDGSIVLHYFSYRPGLYPIVEGVVKE